MRSTFSGLNTMVRGIFTNQLSLDTTGHNITNAGTDGYSRQNVNQAATRALHQSSLYGDVVVGTGVDANSIQRARNVYADKQFWTETATQKYYNTMQTNYDKVEAVFNDSDNTGLQHALQDFYQSWVDLSTSASTAANRVTVVEKGVVLCDTIKTAATELQRQVKAEYDELGLNLTKFNDLTTQIAEINKSIMITESTGATANDLRDERDLLVDKLSEFVNVNVYEDSDGRYTVVSNGITFVNDYVPLTLELADPVASEQYGVTEYTLQIAESKIEFTPTNGIFKGLLDSIDEDKGYLDDVINMGGFLLTAFNDQHKAGVGIDDAVTMGLNFFGDNKNVSEDTSSGTPTEYPSRIYEYDDANQRVTATPATETITPTTSDTGAVTGATIERKKTGTASDILELSGVQILSMLHVAEEFTAPGGEKLVAARSAGSVTIENDTSTGTQTITISDLNGTADGENAVLMSALFNLNEKNFGECKNAVAISERMIGSVSLNEYYSSTMTRLGNNSESINVNIAAQDDIMEQVVNWRESTSGVDWNEELTNMLMFQKGYSACARCLTTMDEMLDRLVNNTGMVGR